MADEGQPFPPHILPAGSLDRDAAYRAEPDALLTALDTASSTLVVELRGGRAETAQTADSLRLAVRPPRQTDRAWVAEGGLALYIGQVGGFGVVALLHVDDDAHPGEGEAFGASLRDVALALPEQDTAVFLTAVALFQWHVRHTHCPRCGAATVAAQAGWVRICEVDQSEHYPRTDPAVIMAVVDADDRLLLARGPRWKGPHRSVLAGFVEPGESFEQAVARETLEESGVTVTDVTYVGNQPWPFPASLMIGFMTRATSVDLTPQAGEIEAIGWYSRADVDAGLADGTLRLPGRLSIARTLIENWYGGPLKAKDFA